MQAAEFFERFGGSARTKNIRRAEGSAIPGAGWRWERPSVQVPSTSGLPPEFIRLCPWEMEFLYVVARRARTGILEVGRFNGGSTFLLACAAPNVSIHSIDITPQDDELLRRQFEAHQVGSNVSLITGDSQHARYDTVGPVDLLFIDGDHSYDGCMADIRNWYGNVVPNGLLVFHDSYLHPEYGVQDAILDFLAERGEELEVVVSPLIGTAPWRFPHGSMACLRKTLR